MVPSFIEYSTLVMVCWRETIALFGEFKNLIKFWLVFCFNGTFLCDVCLVVFSSLLALKNYCALIIDNDKIKVTITYDI